jgi:hypothetical protein
VTAWLHPAGEQPIVSLETFALNPSGNRSPRLFGDFELDGPSGLLLKDHHPPFDAARGKQIRDTQPDEIATAELAVQGKVEEGQVAGLMGNLQANSDSPNVEWLERELCARGLPGRKTERG